MVDVVLETERLLLRSWRAADREPFADLNADPEVMAHFPAPLSRADSDALVDRIEARFAVDGYGLWAAEIIDTGTFIGFVGLNPVPPTIPVRTGGREVGWRLSRSAWGQGYASEAARAALAFGIETARLPDIVSFTAATNLRSQAVMRRIGMTHDPSGDFDHPALAPDHRLRCHVLYRYGPPGAPKRER